MRGLKHKLWAAAFAVVPILVLTQVAWWATVFTRDAEFIAQLQTANVEQAASTRGSAVPADTLAQIRNEAYHRKLMFLSESSFFALLTCVGIGLLYRSVRAERRLREVQTGFLEMVSHEAKTPLTALKLRLESLRDKAVDAHALSELASALDEVRRLSGVLEKTMELNRSERRALQFETLSLADVVASVAHRLQPWLQARRVELDLHLDPEVCVSGDFASLQNSVQSLLENAVQYNPEAKKRVRISVAARGGQAVLTVTDNGPGVAPEEGRRVFERFYRGQLGKEVSGTGLGLYFTKAIVEAHRGAIRLVPATESGACFEIEIPQAVPV